MSQEISIQFTRFSAFYSPLIATMAGGFLVQEGLRPRHSVSAPGTSAITGLVNGSVHVAQSAPSQAFGPLEQGKQPPVLHFAQINEMDGFFLVGRAPEPQFTWDRLKGRKVLVDHGAQPMAMFKYACHRRGLPFQSIVAVDAGSTEKMIDTFRKGEGDYIHLQGPAVLPRCRSRRAHQDHRHLPDARQLDPACGDHAPGLGSDGGHLHACRPDHAPASLRRRYCFAPSRSMT